MTAKLGLEFGNLPLVEATVRASFNDPKALSYSLVNSIHADLKPSFPALTESQQLEIAPGAGARSVEIGPGYLPGAVYTGHTGGISVHVQPQVIVARWIKDPGSPERGYSRYLVLRVALLTSVAAFQKASGDDYCGIAVVNISYVTFIPSTAQSSILNNYLGQMQQFHILLQYHMLQL